MSQNCCKYQHSFTKMALTEVNEYGKHITFVSVLTHNDIDSIYLTGLDARCLESSLASSIK